MASTDLQFDEWVSLHQGHIELVLDTQLPAIETVPTKLHEAMRYAVMGGGKRVRALLAYAAGELLGANIEQVDRAAAAVELIHAFSLVHDDMPCMDDDDLRRGKPSTHKAFDDATALLTGDALQTLAFEIIAEPDATLTPVQQNKIILCLAQATGSNGMAGGQSIDLESTNQLLDQPALELMHQYKTGALISAASNMGAYCAPQADSDKMRALDYYNKAIGLAFQVIDDILDTEADTATLGKTAGKDAETNKATYVTVLGLEKAKELANSLYQDALSQLEPYPEANALRGLANLIIKRRF